MCQYITITLPRETRLDEVQSLFDRFEMSQHLIHNAHLQSQIESDYYYINTTSRMCDCDSVIASNAQHLNEKEKYASDIKRKKAGVIQRLAAGSSRRKTAVEMKN